MKPLNITVGILCALVVLGGVYFLTKKTPQVEEQEQVINTPQGEPVFTWSYSSTEKDGIPKTVVSLTARYPDSSVTAKTVDTIEGTCNEYENRDADVYSKSSMIICYYAGLGRYFKVVQNGDVYEVKRKVFEEASPDYNPPVLPFETIITF